MAHEFKIGDHVEWNSEAGRVRGTITKKIAWKLKKKWDDDARYSIERWETDGGNSVKK